MKITVHTLLKNEENFCWYSIMSVIDYVDEVMVWDTGSTDKTIDILNKINNKKISFRKIKLKEFDEGIIRQQMLDQTKTDWLLILDADEIWWCESIKLVTNTIRKNGNNLSSIVVPTLNMVGDMFHYQGKQAGRYNLIGKTGHYAIRAMNRKIPGLHGVGDYGIFMWADGGGRGIENLKKIKYLNAPYIHTTHLKRSGEDENTIKRKFKIKHEIGIETGKDFYYPEVFFKDRPSIVPSIWESMNLGFKLRSYFETPLRKIYRRTLMRFKRHGY